MTDPRPEFENPTSRRGRPARARSGLAALLSPLCLWTGLGLGGIAFLLGCAGTVALLLTVSNVPAGGGVDLVVSVKLDGRPAMETLRLTPPQDLSRFGIELPGDTRGTLAIEVNAFDRDGCAVASGTTEVMFDGGSRKDGGISLLPIVPRRCTLPEPCGPGTLCEWSPKPQTRRLAATWMINSTDAWAVGAAGTVVHFDGTAWTSVASGETADLRGVWASGPKDVWAVGAAGTILHYDGTAFSKVASSTTADLNGVSGRGPSEVWAVGAPTTLLSPGVALRYDGTKWAPAAGLPFYSGTLFAVYLPPTSGYVYLGGETGQLLRYNGSTWSRISLSAGANLYALWGPSATPIRVYAAGEAGYLARVSVGDTTVERFINGAGDLHGISGTASEQLTVVSDGGKIYTGTSTLLNFYPILGVPVVNLTAIHQTTSSDGWIVGEHGAIFRLSAAGGLTSALTGPFSDLRAVWGTSNSDVWAVGAAGTSFHNTGFGWTAVTTNGTGNVLSNLVALWGSGPKDVWAVPDSGLRLLHYDGTGWVPVVYPNSDVARFQSVAGAQPGTVFFGGVSTFGLPVVVRYSGGVWETVTLNSSIGNVQSMWVSSALNPLDLWAVSDRRIDHLEGSFRTPSLTHYPVNADVRDIWGSGTPGAVDVWAVGLKGATQHFQSSSPTWTAVPTGVSASLNAVWGSGPADVWAVGDAGTALRYDGATWHVLSTGSQGNLLGVWGSRLYDLWAVGEFGLSLRSQR